MYQRWRAESDHYDHEDDVDDHDHEDDDDHADHEDYDDHADDDHDTQGLTKEIYEGHDQAR